MLLGIEAHAFALQIKGTFLSFKIPARFQFGTKLVLAVFSFLSSLIDDALTIDANSNSTIVDNNFAVIQAFAMFSIVIFLGSL